MSKINSSRKGYDDTLRTFRPRPDENYSWRVQAPIIFAPAASVPSSTLSYTRHLGPLLGLLMELYLYETGIRARSGSLETDVVE